MRLIRGVAFARRFPVTLRVPVSLRVLLRIGRLLEKVDGNDSVGFMAGGQHGRH